MERQTNKERKMKKFYDKNKHDIKLCLVIVLASAAVAIADIYFPVGG